MGDYHDLYLKSDVLILADVFENFRKTGKEYYNLDTAHNFSCPGFAWDAMLIITDINLKLITPGFNCWFSFAPVFQWCCSTPQGSPGVGRNTFLSSPHLCFIIVFICDLFVSRDDPLMS